MNEAVEMRLAEDQVPRAGALDAAAPIQLLEDPVETQHCAVRCQRRASDLFRPSLLGGESKSPELLRGVVVAAGDFTAMSDSQRARPEFVGHDRCAGRVPRPSLMSMSLHSNSHLVDSPHR